MQVNRSHHPPPVAPSLEGRWGSGRGAWRLAWALALALAACAGTASSPEVVDADEDDVCGDGLCGVAESCAICPDDCGECEALAPCGDGVCAEAEDCERCPGDCGACVLVDVCGDGVCGETEDCGGCAEDCGGCMPEPRCGDGVCSAGESCDDCPEDCGACAPRCGDGVCTAPESCLSCAGDCGACPAGDVDIWSPRPTAPEFAQPGGVIRVEVRGPASLAPGGWSAMVSSAYQDWPCAVTAKRGRINLGTEDGWVLQVRLPPTAPPELLKLHVAHAAVGRGSRLRAVQVVRDFEESFYAVHQTDHHVGFELADSGDGSASDVNLHPGTTESMEWGARAINLINPRFVIITGDNVLVYFKDSWKGLKRGKERLRYFRDGLSAYRVATMATTGNHDIGYPGDPMQPDYKAAYASIIGPRAFTRRLGSFYVELHEWAQAEYTAAIRSDYRASFNDASVLFRLSGSHYFTTARQIPSASHPASLQLVGHTHTGARPQKTPFPIIVSPMTKENQRSRLIQFNRKPKGWNSPLITDYENNKNVFDLHGAWGTDATAPLLEVFDKANDGTQTSNRVTITNKLAFNFWHGRTVFVMARGSYAVGGAGVPEATYDSRDGKKTVVLVRVNIPAKKAGGPGRAVVSIAPAP